MHRLKFIIKYKFFVFIVFEIKVLSQGDSDKYIWYEIKILTNYHVSIKRRNAYFIKKKKKNFFDIFCHNSKAQG